MEKIAETPRSGSEQHELDYSRKIMEQIYVFYNAQEFVDVVFNVFNPAGVLSVSAHRLILAAASPYFRRLFNSAEGECSIITIAGIDSDVFERLIAFCYNGKALLTTGNVGNMLKGAMQLELTDAVTECANYLMKHLSEYPLLKALALVNETGCEILEKWITDYTVANFEKVSQEAVNELSVLQIETVLLNPGMRTYAQANLFGVIKRWYEHDKNARESVLPKLIGSLQFSDFDSEFLVKQIRPLPGCTDLADKAIMGREGGYSLIVAKLYGSDEQNLLRYNKEKEEWVKCEVKSDAFDIRKSDYFNKKIYYIANSGVGNMFCFDLQTKTTMPVPPMQTKLNSESLVLLDGKIYVMGTKIGYGNGPLLMEMFNPSTDEWQTKADLPKAREGFAAIALNGKIFVIGGERTTNLDITGYVHSYDPKTDIWTECAPLAQGLWRPGAAVHKGQIYVLGGYSEGKYLRSVQRYNPERNEWTKIGSLIEAGDNIFGISFNNELLAIGGWNGSESSSNIEAYDEENDEWVVKKGLPDKGEFNAYAVPTALSNSLM